MDRGRTFRWGIVTVVFALIVGIGGYALYRYSVRYLHGTDCSVTSAVKDDNVELDLGQAANAATIAAVALKLGLPEQALVVAFATVIQESKIRNLEAGDRDSIGLFQQRPSQGWGSPAELIDPVYASTAFFKALKKVRHYQSMPVEEAAQEVQRSADGSAYAAHVDNARILAAGFDGRRPGAVNCWFAPNHQTPSRRSLLPGLLAKSYGSVRVTTRSTAEDLRVSVAGDTELGWSVASWAVSYAQAYGVREIQYAGRHWTSGSAYDGWKPDTKATGDLVVIR